MFKRIQKLYLIIHRPCKKRYAFTEKGIAYDRNGNITALRRYGASASAAEDDFAFNMTDNRISSLTDAANRWRYSGKEEQKALNSAIDEYKLFSRNCTTTVSDVLNSAGSSVLKGSTI